MSALQLKPRRLKGRADYFFGSRVLARVEVSSFANRMAELGPIAVIGGMLRDLYLAGNRYFVSDVDFVISPSSLPEFDRLAALYLAQKNRFGGYGLKLGRWKVDIWPLERTWAAVHGHVDVHALADLTKVTFFDWDAIIYKPHEGNLFYCADWFERVDQRILEINLEPNPNPLGNAVRALRYARRWNAKLGPRLAQHVYTQIFDSGWDCLVQSERTSFTSQILRHLDSNRVIELLKACERDSWAQPADLRLGAEQTRFALNVGSAAGSPQ
jgi:hypothetical protein